MDMLGKKLGNYQMKRLIGHGGFADVYLGEHIYLRTQAAIKVLYARVEQDQNSIQYFLTEAQTIARLAHPHIIRVLEFGIEQGTPYLVMEFAPHGTLRQHLPRQVPLSISMAIYYAKQVASALQYAHANHLIHRDVKPENFLLGAGYEVLLGDFGISSLAHSSKSLSTQEVAGTISYMAPEQIQGKPRQASDQYALGIVMYEWLTGRYPFTGSFMEIATQHMFTEPPPPRSLDPTIPPAVEEAVLIALSKKPEERFLSVEAFARALEQAALPSLSPGEIALLRQQPGSPEMRDFLYKTLNVATLMAVPTLQPGEVATMPPHMGAIQAPAALPSHIETIQAPITSPSHMGAIQAPTALSNLLMQQVVTEQRTSPPLSRRAFFSALAGFAVVMGAGALAFWEIGTHPGGANTTPTSGSPLTNRGTATTPAQTATADQTSTPAATPTPEPTRGAQVNQPVIFQQNTAVYSVAWNHNGSVVASSGDGPLIQIWNPLNAQSQGSISTGQAHIYSLSWSPDNVFLAAAYGDGTASVWDAAQSTLYSSLTGGHAKRINSIGWSPDGGYLVTGSGDNTVALWNASSGNLLNVYTGHTGYVNTAVWSPNGNLIASGGQDRTLHIWSPSSLQAQATGSGHTSDIISLAWSPDSQRIVTASQDGTAKVWDAQSGNLLLTYRGHHSFVVAVSWSQNGQKIVTGGGDHIHLPTDTSAQVWNPDNGQLLSSYGRHSNEIESIAWSPDSRKIASASDDTTVQIWPA